MTYTKDELDNAYIAGQRNATPHKMSEETKQQFKTMGEDITNLKVSNAKIEGKIDSLTEMLKVHMTEEGENKKSLEITLDKKAGIWVERVLIGVGSVIGVAILSALLGLILVK
jgi:hypothetical protein